MPVCRHLGVASGFVHDQVEGLQHAKGRQLLLHLHTHATCLLGDSAQHSWQLYHEHMTVQLVDVHTLVSRNSWR